MEFFNKIKTLAKGVIAWVVSQLRQLAAWGQQKKTSVGSRINRLWQALTFSQHCYLVATLGAILLLYATEQDLDGGGFRLLGILALVGISVEFWPKFLKTWESLPGRALILLFYAVVANFALGSASGLVNEVTGVSAGALPYSHNFALLLNLPGWFFITTMLALLLWQLSMPFYLFLLLLLKLFGMHGLWHPPHYQYVFTTALVRYIWSMVLLAQLWTIGSMTGIAGNEGVDAEYYQELSSELAEVVKQEQQLKEQDVPDEELQASLQKIDAGKRELEQIKTRADNYYLGQQQLLAWFVFDYEADGKSRCQHPEGTKVVELNDYEILQIAPLQDYDNDAEVGYHYQVLPCISPALGHEFAKDSQQKAGKAP